MGEEKWIRYDNLKHKKSWFRPDEPSISTAKPNIHGYKLMLVYYGLLQPNETITGKRYQQQLMQLSRALKKNGRLGDKTRQRDFPARQRSASCRETVHVNVRRA
ncbi:hypothetical protein AVEN_7176-1 [Araneus ventricosus]|uniref:Uncharacterized protein n=1 Tax=Araneus ventricosus TaxID=182803 RepID=A0A4Y2GRK1_ARAVE|nr:hypothetical protein AVEN_7176-1 [Araneus ventricosus]